MPVRTKSLGERVEKRADGLRVLIALFRPRGMSSAAEPWDAWDKRLAPSQELFDAYRGRKREGGRVTARGLEGISWEEYERRFREQMQAPGAQTALAEWRAAARAGTVTLLCHCEDASHCHRSIVAALLDGGQA
jgi:uncharacterized protein YeaO (DUF488 family)